jgi:hypothetical protein
VRGLSFEQMVVGLLFTAIACTACLMPAQSDTYWHLRAGEDIWRTFAVPLVDTYSYTAAGRFWPNHEWLWQAASFGVHRVGGFPLLVLLGAAMVTAACVGVYRLMVGSPLRRFGLMVLGMPLSASVWALRPQIVSLGLLTLLLTLIVHERYRWMPLLFVLWANVHGGVALGGAVLAAITIVTVVRAHAGDAQARRRARALVVVTPLCAVATLLTPLGFRLWSFILESPLRSREVQINEWMPSYPTAPLEIAFWIIALAFLVLIGKRWRELRSWPDVALVVAAAALLPLAARAGRNIAPFIFAVLPAGSRLLGADFRFKRPWPRSPGAHVNADRPTLNLIIFWVFALVGAGVIATAWATSLPRLGWHPVSDGALAAVRACPDRLYNQYGEGGFLIWWAREKRVFLDSRQDPYPPELVLEARDIEARGAYGPTFSRYGIQCAFLPRDSVMRRRLGAAGWRTRFSDETWAILEAPVPHAR